MPKIKFLFSIFLAFSFLFLVSGTIGAQSDITNIAFSVSIKDQNVQNGDIICSDTDGYTLCKTEYNSSIYGVVNDTPSLSIEVGNIQNSHLVVSKGEIAVRVSSVNGDIKVGDFITTSTQAGVGELATKTGFVIGTALEEYTSADKNAVGQIRISLNIHPRVDIIGNTRENLLDLLRSGLAGLGVNPIAALRYLAASVMVIVSFVIGFLYFGRIAKAAIEAIGRNPLASIRIQASMLVTVLIMLVVFFVGLATAYLILAL